MPTKFYIRPTTNLQDPARYTVQESVEDLTEAVNAALSNGDKFITVKTDDGKQCSVEAKRVDGIKDA